MLALGAQSATPAPTRPQEPTPGQIEQEVLENVEHQPLGDGTLEDLALPEAFLRRVADRIVRASYEQRYRIVVEDEGSPSAGGGAGGTAGWRSPIKVAVGLLVLAGIGWIMRARRKERGAQ